MKIIMTDCWNQYLNRIPDVQKDIYFYEEYIRLYETEKSKAVCVVCCEEDRILLMPFLKREEDGFYDFETAYGYGGPITNATDPDWINQALENVMQQFKKEHYICGFIRFHTLIENVTFCETQMQVLFDRNTVVMDTSVSETEMWEKQITSKNRNMIRKAEKNGLIYRAEYDFVSMEEFIGLYNATMERLGAEKFYYFDKNYYEDFIEKFKGKAFLGTIRKDGEMICGALFMYSAKYGHYHLEGSNHKYSSIGANNLLLWKTAVEMHKNGIEKFHLGGGYDPAPDNSLLKFKKSFGKNLKNFYVGKWIFDQEKYDALKSTWEIKNPDKVEKYGKLLLCYKY